MEYSAEIRWFFDDKAMPEIEAWFDNNRTYLTEHPKRTDYYLQAEELLTHGIKIREGKFEVKVQQHDWGQVNLVNENAGRINMWCKYSFALKEGDKELRHIAEAFKGLRSVGLNKEWIRVDKKRKQIKYLVDPEKSLVNKVTSEKTPPQGCNVELATVSINHGRECSTFGLEAYGKGVDVKKNLDLALGAVFSDLSITGLGMQDSFSYPEFIFKGRNIM